MSCATGCCVSCSPRRETSAARSPTSWFASRRSCSVDAEAIADFPASVRLPDPLGNPTVVHDFDELCELIREHLERRRSRLVARANRQPARCRRSCAGSRERAFTAAISSAAATPPTSRPTGSIGVRSQVSVIDIHNLHDRAKRFVVGVVIKKLFEAKERSGQARPLVFLVLDELNKYAPREGWSPIKEVLLDIAERGRSLGVILIGAQQTASEVERRVVANSRDPRRRPPRRGGGRARRIRLPVAPGAPARGDPQAGLDAAPAAADPGPAADPLPLPVVGDASQRGGDARPRQTRSQGSTDEAPAHRRLARRAHASPPPAPRGVRGSAGRG